MKKHLLLFSVFLFLFVAKTFSQTVYVNKTGDTYHTNKCKLYTKNFEAVPLNVAMGAYGKKPCRLCNPPTKETTAAPKKKHVKSKSKKHTPAKK